MAGFFRYFGYLCEINYADVVSSSPFFRPLDELILLELRIIDMIKLILKLFLIFPLTVLGQTGPQGLDGKYVLWMSIQAEQRIGSGWTSSTALAYARRSSFKTPNPSEAVRYFACWNFQQEFTKQIGKKIRLNAGALYLPVGTEGQKKRYPAYYIHEFRLSPRFLYDLFSGKKGKLTIQEGNDFRFFVSSGLPNQETAFGIRQRLALILNVPLAPKDQIVFLSSAEALAGTRRNVAPKTTTSGWMPYNVTEMRIRLYLRFKLQNNLFLDVGHMGRLLFPFRADNPKVWSDYVGIGLVIRDLFHSSPASPLDAPKKPVHKKG